MCQMKMISNYIYYFLLQNCIQTPSNHYTHYYLSEDIRGKHKNVTQKIMNNQTFTKIGIKQLKYICIDVDVKKLYKYAKL